MYEPSQVLGYGTLGKTQSFKLFAVNTYKSSVVFWGLAIIFGVYPPWVADKRYVYYDIEVKIQV